MWQKKNNIAKNTAESKSQNLLLYEKPTIYYPKLTNITYSKFKLVIFPHKFSLLTLNFAFETSKHPGLNKKNMEKKRNFYTLQEAQQLSLQ